VVRVVIQHTSAKTNKRVPAPWRRSISFGCEFDGGMIRGGQTMWLRNDDAVTAGGFATVKGHVRAFHDGVEVQIGPDHLSDTRGEGYLNVSGRKGNRGRGETVAKLFGDVEGSADVGLRQHDRKLFAAEARDEVGPTEPGAEQVGDGAKSDIASIVTVAIVDGLE